MAPVLCSLKDRRMLLGSKKPVPLMTKRATRTPLGAKSLAPLGL